MRCIAAALCFLAACVPSGDSQVNLQNDGAVLAASDTGAAASADAAFDGGFAADAGFEADAGFAADAAVFADAAAVPDASSPDAGFPDSGPCGAPPAGASAGAVAAYERANELRRAMGVPCVAMNLAINTAAERHCAYYAMNRGNAQCTGNPHAEVSGCPLFVAERFDGRMRAAGYNGPPAFENMHFINNGSAAIDGWVDSVWHRTPVLSPWIAEFGYGAAGGCDTADYGIGSPAPASTIAVFPYDGMTGVPLSFDGRREGPNPPAPSTGWPSGYPIHLYFRGTVSEHVLTIDGQNTPIDHVWLAPGDPLSMGLLRTELVMYANEPLSAATRYRVRIAGSSDNGPLALEWTFTTR